MNSFLHRLLLAADETRPRVEDSPGARSLGWTERANRFLLAEDGPTAVEYAVMLAFILIVCIATVTTLGTNTSAFFQASADALAAAGP
jgi:pilus assembly protein Flp/PilA